MLTDKNLLKHNQLTDIFLDSFYKNKETGVKGLLLIYVYKSLKMDLFDFINNRDRFLEYLRLWDKERDCIKFLINREK